MALLPVNFDVTTLNESLDCVVASESTQYCPVCDQSDGQLLALCLKLATTRPHVVGGMASAQLLINLSQLPLSPTQYLVYCLYPPEIRYHSVHTFHSLGYTLEKVVERPEYAKYTIHHVYPRQRPCLQSMPMGLGIPRTNKSTCAHIHLIFYLYATLCVYPLCALFS